MKLAIVRGSVTATIKEADLGNRKLLVCDAVDINGDTTEPAIVAADNLGAGQGDLVLLACGSAARIPGSVSGAAIDATIVALVDEVDVSARAKPIGKKKSSARKI